MIVLLLSICLLLAVIAILLLFAVIQFQGHVMETHTANKIEHEECVNFVAWHVRAEFAAIVLDHAAEEWDSVENIKVLERLRREWNDKPDATSVAAMWLREHALKWKENHP